MDHCDLMFVALLILHYGNFGVLLGKNNNLCIPYSHFYAALSVGPIRGIINLFLLPATPSVHGYIWSYLSNDSSFFIYLVNT